MFSSCSSGLMVQVRKWARKGRLRCVRYLTATGATGSRVAVLVPLPSGPHLWLSASPMALVGSSVPVVPFPYSDEYGD